MDYQFTLPTDHFQFFLEDDRSEADSSDIWDAESMELMLAVAPGLIAIGTARYGGITNISISIQDREPQVTFDSWDRIVHCGIEVHSGRLVVCAAESNHSVALRISVQPGAYQALALFQNLTNILDEEAETGEDSYHVILWPGDVVPPRLLKPLSPK